MKIYICSINFNSLFKSYYTKQGAISEVEMDFQNNIKIKMFSGLWFLNLWVKFNLFHSTVDIPYRNIHKYQALQNITSESKGRSYPAVQKKCCNHCSQKSLSLMLWSFFLMYWLQKRRKCSISRCNYPQQARNTTNHRSGWFWICWQQHLFFLFIQSKPLPNKSLMTELRISHVIFALSHWNHNFSRRVYFYHRFPSSQKIVPLAKIVKKLTLCRY